MADINGVTLQAGSSPTVYYTITYSKSRPNNSQMTYNFTVSCALQSSGSYIGTGYALICTITVNGSSGQVRIKANDNDNWNGTAPRIRTVSVTCSSATGNAAQGVRFQVVSDGRLTLTSGVIDNSGYTVTSAPLLTTACGAPSACSVSSTLAEGNVTLSWSGASGGINNGVTGYEIQYSDSSNNSSWGSWAALTTVSSTGAGGSLSVAPPSTRGYYRRFQVRTQGSAGSGYYSGWKVSSNSVRKNTPPIQPSVVTASPAVYSNEVVTLTWSGASGGTSAIKGYMIASRTSTDNSTWSAWSVLATIALAASGGSYTPVVSRVPGTYTQFGVWTIDAFDVYSSERVSGSIHCVSAACDEPAVAAPKAGSSTYNPHPYFLISTGAQPDEQVVCVKIDSGDWQDSVHNPDLFSAGGTIGKNTGVVFRPTEQAPGAKTVTVRCLNASFEAPSPEVSRTFTILPSPFETITANVTRVKAAHLLALRAAVNTVRGYYGLPPAAWAEGILPGATPISRWPYHILEIRSALGAAVQLINHYDPNGTAFDIPAFDWLPLGTGRPRADVTLQIQNLILAL